MAPPTPNTNTVNIQNRAKEAIRRYHFQLLRGCGNATCQNRDCASSGNLPLMDTNEAAARAIQCYREKAVFCTDSTNSSTSTVTSSQEENLAEQQQQQENNNAEEEVKAGPSIMTENDEDDPNSASDAAAWFERMQTWKNSFEDLLDMEDNDTAEYDEDELMAQENVTNMAIEENCVPFTTESSEEITISVAKISDIMLTCQNIGDWTPMRRWVGKAFSNMDVILRSFHNGDDPVDFDRVRRCFTLLFSCIHDGRFLSSLVTAVYNLCSSVEFELKYHNMYTNRPQVVDLLLIVMELPIVNDFDFIRHQGFLHFGSMCNQLPEKGKLQLISQMSARPVHWLLSRVQAIQQMITVRLLEQAEALGARYYLKRLSIDDDQNIVAAIKLLNIFYTASLMAGVPSRPFVMDFSAIHDPTALSALESESEKRLRLNNSNDESGPTEDSSENGTQMETGPSTEGGRNPLKGFNPWDVCTPLIDDDEFCNETLSQYLNVEEDFVSYKSRDQRKERGGFSVLPDQAFLVTTAVKQQFLFFENRIRMQGERRQAIAVTLDSGLIVDPYLRLKVRRNQVVKDALDVLGVIALTDPNAFKKQLRVEFQGEDGVDEGGLSKEFYQLVIDRLFDADYGMFVYEASTDVYWFNPACTYCKNEYTLIGILFALAIYNHILVDVRFPLVLYRKLFGRRGVFADLKQVDPHLHRGLTDLMDYQSDDVEEAFCYSFHISYTDVYGHSVSESLKVNGENIPVTKHNRLEFVDHYADFLLNRAVDEQFGAFGRGFRMVVDQSMLMRLCGPKEIEQLVCGVADLDFTTLEKSTRYENGYTETEETIILFWKVAINMDDTEKRLLLQFTTGCDRSPVGGLAKLDFIIARHGDDPLRLPTAHTCFNILLLPDYKCEEILRERLMKAITNCRGFGLQ